MELETWKTAYKNGLYEDYNTWKRIPHFVLAIVKGMDTAGSFVVELLQDAHPTHQTLKVGQELTVPVDEITVIFSRNIFLITQLDRLLIVFRMCVLYLVRQGRVECSNSGRSSNLSSVHSSKR